MKNTVKTRCLNLLLGILILAGCSNPALERAETPTSSGTGAVSVRIGTAENAVRTLAPANLSGLTYTLTFSNGPAAHDAVDITSGTSISLELPVGTWTITATAYTGTTAVASGSAPVTVAAGENTPADIILAPVEESTGTFHYSINVPSNATGNLVIVKADGTAVDNGDITLNVGTNAGNLNLPSGQYLMSVRLTQDEKSAGRTEAVHIYRGMTTRAEYTFTANDFRVVISLADNVWMDGEIAASEDVHWYSFTASAGSTYQVQWNTQYSGDGTYTLPYAYVSAFRDDGSYIFLEEVYGWTTPRTVSGVNGTVYLLVQGYSSGYTGTYAIRYYDSTSLPPQAAMSIYSVTVTPVPSCVINWNYVEGVTGYHLYRSDSFDGDYARIAEMEGAYNYSYTDTDVSTGSTYYYQVAAYNAHGEGVRSSSVSGTPPASSAITALSANVWADSEIASYEDVHWYSFTASEGSTYQVQWNTQYYGDGTQTLYYAYVSALRADGSYIFQQVSNGWTSPPAVSGVSGTVYLKVEGFGNTGTYTIMYKIDDRIAINVGFNYGTIDIEGSDGSNAISQSGTNGKPTSLSLSASGYTDVVWYVDGAVNEIADTTDTEITLLATDYAVRIHSITFTGKRDGNLYSQVIPFTVLD